MEYPYILEIPYIDPVVAFAPFADQSGAIFLDSATAHGNETSMVGQYSFIAVSPWQILGAKNHYVDIDGIYVDSCPWTVLHNQMSLFSFKTKPGFPPFQGGIAGFWGYELAHHLEDFPYPPTDDMQFPDMCLGFYDVVAAYDHGAQKAWIFSSGLPETGEFQEKKARDRAHWLAANLGSVSWPVTISPTSNSATIDALQIMCTFDPSAYENILREVIGLIYAGDIYQANISRRFCADIPHNFRAFDLYRRLRQINSAPFAAFLNFPDIILASASPERFLQVKDRRVETQPIKGTIPRSMNPEIDAERAATLQSSEKDRAENIMIVDLLRNDLSKVCEPGSVHVPKLAALESFATVHHLVSTVTGVLRHDVSLSDLWRATFPGGSITGAPKIRAMEIISAYEPTYRGPYCGAIGYMGFDGAMDSSITIRTYAIKDDKITFQAGGGIVADSNPAQEYDETTAKAAALIRALQGYDQGNHQENCPGNAQKEGGSPA